METPNNIEPISKSIPISIEGNKVTSLWSICSSIDKKLIYAGVSKMKNPHEKSGVPLMLIEAATGIVKGKFCDLGIFHFVYCWIK